MPGWVVAERVWSCENVEEGKMTGMLRNESAVWVLGGLLILQRLKGHEESQVRARARRGVQREHSTRKGFRIGHAPVVY